MSPIQGSLSLFPPTSAAQITVCALPATPGPPIRGLGSCTVKVLGHAPCSLFSCHANPAIRSGPLTFLHSPEHRDMAGFGTSWLQEARSNPSAVKTPQNSSQSLITLAEAAELLSRCHKAQSLSRPPPKHTDAVGTPGDALDPAPTQDTAPTLSQHPETLRAANPAACGPPGDGISHLGSLLAARSCPQPRAQLPTAAFGMPRDPTQQLVTVPGHHSLGNVRKE